VPSTTLAVLRAAPGMVSISSMVFGTLPPNSETTFFAAPTMDLALLLKKPVLRISLARTSGRTAAKSVGVGYLANRPGVNFVDALIGALGGKNGGHQQFPRVSMVEGASGGGVHLVQSEQDCGDPLLPLGCGFRAFHVSS